MKLAYILEGKIGRLEKKADYKEIVGLCTSEFTTCDIIILISKDLSKYVLLHADLSITYATIKEQIAWVGPHHHFFVCYRPEFSKSRLHYPAYKIEIPIQHSEEVVSITVGHATPTIQTKLPEEILYHPQSALLTAQQQVETMLGDQNILPPVMFESNRWCSYKNINISSASESYLNIHSISLRDSAHSVLEKMLKAINKKIIDSQDLNKAAMVYSYLQLKVNPLILDHKVIFKQSLNNFLQESTQKDPEIQSMWCGLHAAVAAKNTPKDMEDVLKIFDKQYGSIKAFYPLINEICILINVFNLVYFKFNVKSDEQFQERLRVKFSDEFINQYKRFLIHKNTNGEKVPNLEHQVRDFKNAVDYMNSILEKSSISELTAEELVNALIQIHQRACPNLYQTILQTKNRELPGEFRRDLSLELKCPPGSEKFYQGMSTEHVYGMACFLRRHYPISESDIGLEFLSGYYKIIWSLDFNEEQRAVFKRRVTMDYLTKEMQPQQSLAFQMKYGVLAKQPNPPAEWEKPYLEISRKLDSAITELERTALEKIFWVRDCDNLREKTLNFAMQLIEAVKNGSNPIEIFARFSYRFIHIHPFLNGNSRVMHIILNAVLIEAKLPTILLGNVFSTRKELYENYFHPEDEESILFSFVCTLNKAIALEEKEKLLFTKTELPATEWKIYPQEKLTGKFVGHQVRFFTFKGSQKEGAVKWVEELKKDGFDTRLSQASNGNSSIIVDLTDSLRCEQSIRPI